MELLKKQVNDYVIQNGQVDYEKLGHVLNFFALLKSPKRDAFRSVHIDGGKESIQYPNAWLINYIPELKEWLHDSRIEGNWEKWKTLCTNISFPSTKIRIIG